MTSKNAQPQPPAADVAPVKVRLATIWLDGCSGCHMSLLDCDERIIDLAKLVNVVWGPLVDAKEFPTDVDVTLVEGAVSSEEDLHRIKLVRSRTKVLISLGDCAITGNVSALRNQFGVPAVQRRAYLENGTLFAQVPREIIPAMLPIARPVHEIVPVDYFIPGCPPSADLIFSTISDLLAGKHPNPAAKFG
jgi:NAD-reducing hydrogenase small subunit